MTVSPLLAAIQFRTGTDYGYPGDMMALFDADGIPDGTINERLLAWINMKLGTSYDEINGAMAAYAARLNTIGFYNIPGFYSDALQMVGIDQNVAAFSFNDNSMIVRDSLTPGNNYDGFLDGKLTFSRASAKNVWSGSVMNSVGVDQLAYENDPVTEEFRGVLLEPARTNLLLNSTSLSTQGVTVTAQSYALSFYGTGTVTLSGASTAGPLVGTGDLQRVTLVFTPAAGTLTLTVTGTVTYAQLEAGGGPSSWITTTGAAATRATDFLTFPTSMLPWNDNAFTAMVEFSLPYNNSNAAAGTLGLTISDNVAAPQNNHRLRVSQLGGNGKPVGITSVANAVTLSASSTLWSTAANTMRRFAYAAQANDANAACEGITATPLISGAMPTGMTTVRLGGFIATGTTGSEPVHIRKVAIWCGQRKPDGALQSMSLVP